MNRGEVWWVERPEAGRRPHLILTRHNAVAVLNSVIAAPATSTIRGLPTEVRLGPEDGLPQECVLSLDNVTLIRKSALDSRICRLSAQRMREVCKALAIATGCDLRQ